MTAGAVWMHKIGDGHGEFLEACAVADTMISADGKPLGRSAAKILPLFLRYHSRLADGTFGPSIANAEIGFCFAGHVELVSAAYLAASNLFLCIGVDGESAMTDWPELGAVANVVGSLLGRYARELAARGLSYRGSAFPTADVVIFGQPHQAAQPELWHVELRPDAAGGAKVVVRIVDGGGPVFLGSGAGRLRHRWASLVDRGLSPGGDTTLRALGAMIEGLEVPTVGGTTQIAVCRDCLYTPYQTELVRGERPTYLGLFPADFDQNLGATASGCIAMDTVVAHKRQGSP